MKYVDICIALYDYQAQSEEELSFSADNILYILENNDPNWYRAQLKASSNEEGPIGLIPSNYIEKIKPIGHVKALYDYDAQSAAEVSFKEDEQMTLYESKDKDWCVVETVQGNIGLAPSNYVEKTTETSTQQTAAAPTAPIAPIAPVSAPSELDVALSWPVHEYDLKKKRKTKSKGNLLVGNGLLCFGSETDKSSPVRQFPISQIKQTDIDSKVVHIIMDKETLAFQLASQSEAKAVVAKIDASQKAHQPAVNKPPAVDKPLPPLSPTKESKWAVALYAFKPDVDEETYLEEHERVLVTDYDNADWWAVEHKDGTTGIVPANYIQFQEDYEASLKIEEEKKRKLREEEEQRLKDEEENHKKLEEQRKQEEEETRIKQEQEDRLRKEEEARKKLEEEERIKQEEENRKRLEEEAKKKQEEEERKQREEELARKKQEEEERKKREEEERKRREEEELAKKRQEEERLKQEEEARKQREIDERHKEEERQRELAELKRIKEIEQKEKERQTEAERRRRLQDEAIQNELRNKRSSLNSPVVNSPRRSEIPAPPPPVVVPQAHLDSSNPDPSKIRTWTDRTGAFKVQAQFVSCANGKNRLHKMNGVQIDVPVNKMCDEDIHFVEEETDMKLEIEQDEPFSWLEYFKRANLPHDACVEYAGNFEANQLSRRDIEKLTHRQMKMLGMTEKHVQRIQRFIETNQAEPPSDDELTPPKIKKRKSVSFGDVSYIEATPYEEEHDDNVLNQIEEDERLARELQEQEDQEYNRVGLQRRGTGRTYPAPPVPDVSMSPQQLPSQLNTPASSMPAPPSPANAFSNNQSNSGFEDDAWTPRPSPQAPSHWNPPQHTGPSIPPISPQIVDPQYLAKWGGSPALAEANLRPVPAPPTSFTPSPLQQQQSFSSPNISGSSLPQQYNNNMSPTSPMFQQPYPSPLSPQHTNDSTSSVGRNWTNATPENPFGGAPQQPFYIVPPSFGAQQPNQQATTIDPTDKYAVFKNINNPTPSVFNTTRYQ